MPVYMMVTQMFNVCNCDQNVASKTLNTANQSEIPIKQITSVG